MHSAAPLAHFDLTEAQWRLLACLASGPLPVHTDREVFIEATVLAGLDADQAREDLPDLRWMKLVDSSDGFLVITELGVAVHFRALFEASQERLAEIAQLAGARAAVAPRFARVVRRMADGSCSLSEALADLSGTA